MSDGRGDQLAHVWVKKALGDQVLNRAALPERPRETDVWALQQRRAARLIERQQLAHLLAKAIVSKGVRRELVSEEALDDVLGEDDRIEGHGHSS